MPEKGPKKEHKKGKSDGPAIPVVGRSYTIKGTKDVVIPKKATAEEVTYLQNGKEVTSSRQEFWDVVFANKKREVREPRSIFVNTDDGRRGFVAEYQESPEMGVVILFTKKDEKPQAEFFSYDDLSSQNPILKKTVEEWMEKGKIKKGKKPRVSRDTKKSEVEKKEPEKKLEKKEKVESPKKDEVVEIFGEKYTVKDTKNLDTSEKAEFLLEGIDNEESGWVEYTIIKDNFRIVPKEEVDQNKKEKKTFSLSRDDNPLSEEEIESIADGRIALWKEIVNNTLAENDLDSIVTVHERLTDEYLKLEKEGASKKEVGTLLLEIDKLNKKKEELAKEETVAKISRDFSLHSEDQRETYKAFPDREIPEKIEVREEKTDLNDLLTKMKSYGETHFSKKEEVVPETKESEIEVGDADEKEPEMEIEEESEKEEEKTKPDEVFLTSVNDEKEDTEEATTENEEGFQDYEDVTEETNKKNKKITRRKFLGWIGLGAAGVATSGIVAESVLQSKKLNQAAKNLEEAKEKNKNTQADAEKLKKEAEEKKAAEERAEKERIEKMIEQMDMPFFESLPYAGKIFYLAWMNRNQTYLMLDKTKATLYVVGDDNKKKVETIVDLGRVKGEGTNEVKIKNDANTYGTTPSHIYRLSFNTSDEMKAEFGDKAIWMDMGREDYDSGLCIHPVLPSEYKKRKAAIDSPDTADNRISWGCVNVTDIDELREYIHEGTNLVVLPDLTEGGEEMWLDPDRGTFSKVGEGDTDLPSLLTKVEEYAKIRGDIS